MVQREKKEPKLKGKLAVFIDAAKELIESTDLYIDLRKIRGLIERRQ